MQQQTRIVARRPSPALLALVATAAPAPGTDEAYFLGQLRAALGLVGPSRDGDDVRS